MLTIEVENLELAKKKLPTVDSKEIIDSYVKGKILGCSTLPPKLVDGKSHSFLQAMYYSYSDHRPFVLTSESIWLLILQAFSAHINNDSKKFLKKYPKFIKKRTLCVRKDEINWNNSEDCKKIINEFCKKIDLEIKDGFVANLSKGYSTTTEDEEIVFKISTMDTVKSFFEFIVVSVICGIPRVYVTGNKVDWEELINRLEKLRKFDFDWFVDNIVEILKRIAREFDEKIEDNFWINMFKIHTVEEYGSPEMVDGWITNFFPYRKNGERTNKEYFKTTNFRHVVKDINPQIVKLDFTHICQNPYEQTVSESPMLMIAGFVGIKQDDKTNSLKPQLGWAISENTEKLSDLVKENQYSTLKFHNIERFPNEVLEVGELHELILSFDSQISIPKEIKNLEIDLLRLDGRLTNNEKKKIRELFKDKRTTVLINGKNVNTTLLDKAKLIVKKISPFHHEYIDY